MPALRLGIYEHLITHALAEQLRGAVGESEIRTLDATSLPSWLARHLGKEIERALREAGDETSQLALAHRLLGVLEEAIPSGDWSDANVDAPARVLESLFQTVAPLRPTTPLSSSTLLTRGRNEPALGHELSRETLSADRVDILSAFITMGGVRTVRDALEAASRRGTQIRVLTTVFTGITEVRALDELARMPGAQVRVSYDVRRTRLHAKAWLFARESGLDTAYVGSANLTATALGTGQEWMVKVARRELPGVLEKFEGTFEGLWNDAEFEPYDPADGNARERLLGALRAESGAETNTAVLTLFTLNPFPFQLEILDRLAAERALHGRYRNLVVAATGTGKTVIAAFDYLRYCDQTGTKPRLLFLAHRQEILEQARNTFRQVLRDHAFGERLGDGHEPVAWDHVFATIQSAACRLSERVGPSHFRFVVVDECHHAPADTYQTALRTLEPEILLGLTATPERGDGRSLLPDFDGRIAAELRLWHAMERQLLVPFEYYGVADGPGTELEKVRWSRQGYAREDLSALYTGNEARVDLIVGQLRRRVHSLRDMRALAFCVSVEHAEYMARALSERGIPSEVVHGSSSTDARADAPTRLRDGKVNVLCTCDLYNEGVDLPFVDTLLLLRPTASATVFMQQLGRGLRLYRGKTSCLVLDFIGQHRAEFRFDATLAAMTGIPRGKLRHAAETGFPFLPSGCVLQLDAVARERVLASLKRAVANGATIAQELRELAQANATEPSLREYMQLSGRELADIYAAGSWTAIRKRAGLLPSSVGEPALDAARRLGRLIHYDDPLRIDTLRTPTQAVREPGYERLLSMLDFQRYERGILRDTTQVVTTWQEEPVVADEAKQLADALAENVMLAEECFPVADWPLVLHRHYRRREIVAGVGYVRAGEKGMTPQAGVLKLKDRNAELLLVTLDKSAKSFSPTTRYRDYAISPTLFHWETQSIANVSRPSGRRYVESPANGWTFYLFVRGTPEEAYAFLGPVVYQSHRGNRPISITWRLEHAMPGALLDRFATLAQG
jgi:superfamily II DNA or RNA helicase/HKD family nuclease